MNGQAKGLLSSDPLLIFMHLPKTAGSSLRSVFRAIYGEQKMHAYSPMKDLLNDNLQAFTKVHDEAIYKCNDQASIQLIYGHLFYGIDSEITRKCTYTTMMRDPVDRVLSNYYYRLQYGHCVNPVVNLIDYVSGNSPSYAMQFEADNLQTRFLSAMDGKPRRVAFGKCTNEMLACAKRNLADAVSAVGIVERYDESLALFQRSYKWSFIPRNPKERVTAPYVPKNETPRGTLSIIQEINCLDIDLYKFGIQLFEQQLRRAAL